LLHRVSTIKCPFHDDGKKSFVAALKITLSR
jgi:hypothetical protein